MIDAPGSVLTIEPAKEWSASGPLEQTALRLAKAFADSFPDGRVLPHRICTEAAAPDHAGLGTGTQIGLAVARALAMDSGMADMSTPDLARRVGRGERSGIGIHGFEQGGFLIDGGRGKSAQVAPLVARLPVPEDWCVVLITPRAEPGMHGMAERNAFETLVQSQHAEAISARLCRLALMGMLPALAEKDCAEFGNAVYEYNRLAGELFAPVQGGIYSQPIIGGIVEFIRGRGIAGAGQSSWGPTVFAIVKDHDLACSFADSLRRKFGDGATIILVTSANNRGATVEQSA